MPGLINDLFLCLFVGFLCLFVCLLLLLVVFCLFVYAKMLCDMTDTHYCGRRTNKMGFFLLTAYRPSKMLVYFRADLLRQLHVLPH